MKGEISRYSHRPDKRYSGVFWQMGRMLTDADEIELREIVNDGLVDLGLDAVESGAPVEGGVVELDADGQPVALRPGIVYADGVRGEVRASTDVPLGPLDLYENQIDFPNPPPTSGEVVAYVDLWERTVTAVEDRNLLDAGLHGADTSFRTQQMAQLKWCPDDDEPFFESAANPQKGNALLAAELRASVTVPDPCDPCAEELEVDARVGNYLFRLEVHDVTGPADNPDTVILKWSAENGAEHYHSGQEPSDFKTGKHVYEFFSRESESHVGAHGAPGFTPTRRPLNDAYPASAPDTSDWPYVRRWDGTIALRCSGSTLALDLDGDGNPIGSDEGVPLTTAAGLGHVEMAAGVLTLELTSLMLTLDTAGKSFLAGDYWLVEVRERAPHDETTDQRVSVVTEEPLGIVHHYTRLVAIDGDGVFRPLSDSQSRALSFPPLTDIPATHVSFDNNCPDLYGPAENVQEALDALCDADFGKLIREHNRYLHGWGVICGLKVVCEGTQTSKIAITPGCFLDQAGYQVDLTQRTVIDTLELLDGERQSGTFCLSASRREDGTVQFHLDEETDKTIQSILEGTLLWRIYQTCLKPIVDAWRALGGGVRRDVRWALIDLLWPVMRRGQAVNDHPYLTPQQHAILEQLYKVLQDRIVSPTDCALASEFPDFPSYPFQPANAFHGMSFDKTKPNIRLQGDGRRAYAFGAADNEILVIDVDGLKVLRTVTLQPQGLNVLGVHDVAANSDGSVVMAALRAQTTQGRLISAIVRINPQSVSVRHQTAERNYTELAMPGGPSGPLYALAPGDGVYRMTVSSGNMLRIAEGNYVSNLRINPQGSQGWVVRAQSLDSGTSYVVESFSLGTSASTLLTVPLMGNFVPSDLAVVAGGQHFCVVSQTANGAELRFYSAQRSWTNPANFFLGQGVPSLATLRTDNQEIFAVSLGAPTIVNSLWWFDPFKENFRQSRYVNLQILPHQIEGGDGRLVALNQGSRSLVRIDADDILRLRTASQAAAIRNTVETYRGQVIAAYVTLMQLWLKAVRDCICHQLLPDCPTLGDPPHKVPLASLEIVEANVDKICNLGCRKFVVTFPTLFYWMSIAPLIPYLRELLHRLCCDLEFDFLSNLVPDEPGSPDAVEETQFGASFQQAAVALPIMATSPQFAASLSTMGDYGSRLAGTRIRGLAGRVVEAQIRSPEVASINVTGKTEEVAKQDLELNGIEVVEVVDLDRDDLPPDLDVVEAAFTPLSLNKGDKVVLITSKGRAQFHAVRRRPAATAKIDLEGVREELDTLEKRKREIAETRELRDGLSELLQDRSAAENELAEMKADVGKLKEEQAALREATEAEQARLDSLAARREALARESERLVKDIDDSQARFREVTMKTRGDRPVETLTDKADVSNQLVRLGFDNVESVAKLDDARGLVVQGGAINLTTARRLVRDAQRRLQE